MSEELTKLQGDLEHARNLLTYYKGQADQNGALADRWFEEVASLEDQVARLDEYPVGTVAIGCNGYFRAVITKVACIVPGHRDWEESKESRWVSLFDDTSGASFRSLADARNSFKKEFTIVFTPDTPE
jgi:hypothetical protein